MGDRTSTPPDGGNLSGLFGKKVYIETYGCSYNFGDTANLIEVIRHYGSTRVESPEEADAVVVNTCTVIGPTERRMLRRFVALRERPLYVTGCMPLVQREAILSVCDPVIISPDEIRNAYNLIRTVSPGGIGIVQVAQGCLGRCTYCITRKARGPLVSFPVEEIVAKTRAFVARGVCEIQLTAQDVSAWGRDTGTTLPELLAELDVIPGNFRIRVGMMNPTTVRAILPGLIDAYSGEHIFRFLHLPVQSGSDRILAEMRRGNTVEEFREIVTAFRARYPDIVVATDFIVGFPGETDDDFNRSLDLIRAVRPAKVNVTRYSARPFTGPFASKDFPDFVKKDRSRTLNALAEEQYTAMNAPLIGTTVSCVVTEKIRPGSVMARTATYTGVVIPEDLPVGTVIEAALTKDRKYFFLGRRVD
ncbi:MAG: tRNA (N(6)-L-threonylcarbamoyladenosine(37)-C(2))-methylthiotransferase [Methanoregula sp.]|jgi:MiaB-like tRNA modifying enzyme